MFTLWFNFKILNRTRTSSKHSYYKLQITLLDMKLCKYYFTIYSWFSYWRNIFLDDCIFLLKHAGKV
jgi:hypothetical protein